MAQGNGVVITHIKTTGLSKEISISALSRATLGVAIKEKTSNETS